jgi:hypothetical protein
MMQRVLEEACFDFASRWTPCLVQENNWTCPEAVGLSTWKRVLPPAVQPPAIAPVKNYSLDDALRGWDAASQWDGQDARRKLEAALHEIGERPMDDMDWTPIAVSLQEVTADAGPLVEWQEHSRDEVELD